MFSTKNMRCEFEPSVRNRTLVVVSHISCFSTEIFLFWKEGMSLWIRPLVEVRIHTFVSLVRLPVSVSVWPGCNICMYWPWRAWKSRIKLSQCSYTDGNWPSRHFLLEEAFNISCYFPTVFVMPASVHHTGMCTCYVPQNPVNCKEGVPAESCNKRSVCFVGLYFTTAHECLRHISTEGSLPRFIGLRRTDEGSIHFEHTTYIYIWYRRWCMEPEIKKNPIVSILQASIFGFLFQT
jgi:hypothetical protein